ncbi:MAG: hypothetical protein LJF04_06495 [Gemmatimonadetes bacterium]|nr:hypothetical protein [Gemmatimonadota bacterium]
MRRRVRLSYVAMTLATAIAFGVTGKGAAAQDLADFDYVNLSFRGVGVEWGYLFPTRVEPTQSVGVRVDMGYLGPGVRVVPSLTYWSSRFKRSEVAKLEDRVADLVVTQTGERPQVDLGEIDWSDVALALDAQVVWRVPYDMLTFAGLGAAAHILNGRGTAINGTFVEDLLDSVTAGFNLHAGLEYPATDRVRFYGQGRYEVLGDLQYFQLRFGAELMWGRSAPGEERR